MRRRKLLAAGGAGAVAVTAGCLGPTSPDPELEVDYAASEHVDAVAATGVSSWISGEYELSVQHALTTAREPDAAAALHDDGLVDVEFITVLPWQDTVTVSFPHPTGHSREYSIRFAHEGEEIARAEFTATVSAGVQ